MSEKKIAYIVMGRHSRVSNLTMTRGQDYQLTEALRSLGNVLDSMGADWETINIEVKK